MRLFKNQIIGAERIYQLLKRGDKKTKKTLLVKALMQSGKTESVFEALHLGCKEKKWNRILFISCISRNSMVDQNEVKWEAFLNENKIPIQEIPDIDFVHISQLKNIKNFKYEVVVADEAHWNNSYTNNINKLFEKYLKKSFAQLEYDDIQLILVTATPFLYDLKGWDEEYIIEILPGEGYCGLEEILNSSRLRSPFDYANTKLLDKNFETYIDFESFGIIYIQARTIEQALEIEKALKNSKFKKNFSIEIYRSPLKKEKISSEEKKRFKNNNIPKLMDLDRVTEHTISTITKKPEKIHVAIYLDTFNAGISLVGNNVLAWMQQPWDGDRNVLDSYIQRVGRNCNYNNHNYTIFATREAIETFLKCYKDPKNEIINSNVRSTNGHKIKKMSKRNSYANEKYGCVLMEWKKYEKLETAEQIKNLLKSYNIFQKLNYYEDDKFSKVEVRNFDNSTIIEKTQGWTALPTWQRLLKSNQRSQIKDGMRVLIFSGAPKQRSNQYEQLVGNFEKRLNKKLSGVKEEKNVAIIWIKEVDVHNNSKPQHSVSPEKIVEQNLIKEI